MGGFNASVPDLASLHMALETNNDYNLHAWHDVGADAEIWGSTPNEPTCRANNVKQVTRKDYVIANTICFGLIESFQVAWDEVYKVHVSIRFTSNHETLLQEGGVLLRQAH